MLKPNQSTTVSLQTVSVAVAQLKQRLKKDYERAYPDRRQIIHLVLEEEEARAWDLTLFPHLVLPDLVEAHLERLNIHPMKTNQGDVFAAEISTHNESNREAYIITGPTSGFGRATAFEVVKHGTVVLVGRDRGKLDAMQKAIQDKGGQAVSVVCDLSDVASVRRAAAEILSLNFPLAGLVNNAGIMQMRPTRSAQGWEMSYATNHLGPFVLTEALIPHLPDGANVVFVVSGVEDPERKPAKFAGFRGGRYISAEASAQGQWKPGRSNNTGYDAYATSKQCELAAALEFAREILHLIWPVGGRRDDVPRGKRRGEESLGRGQVEIKKLAANF